MTLSLWLNLNKQHYTLLVTPPTNNVLATIDYGIEIFGLQMHTLEEGIPLGQKLNDAQ